jgi:hypothetical protein
LLFPGGLLTTSICFYLNILIVKIKIVISYSYLSVLLNSSRLVTDWLYELKLTWASGKMKLIT